jgi:hypothetical protein
MYKADALARKNAKEYKRHQKKVKLDEKAKVRKDRAEADRKALLESSGEAKDEL